MPRPCPSRPKRAAPRRLSQWEPPILRYQSDECESIFYYYDPITRLTTWTEPEGIEGWQMPEKARSRAHPRSIKPKVPAKVQGALQQVSSGGAKPTRCHPSPPCRSTGRKRPDPREAFPRGTCW